MGRWLARLSEAEKNSETPPRVTDKTDKTPAEPVSSVLSVPQPAVCENSKGGMTDWPALALDAVPIVPLAPIAPTEGANGTIGTNGTEAEGREKVGTFQPSAVAKLPDVGELSAPRASERSEASPNVSTSRRSVRPPDWMPNPAPGIAILRPAVEVSAREYDAHLDRLIAALPDGSAERNRMLFAKRKGWVVDRDGERVFTRGRM